MITYVSVISTVSFIKRIWIPSFFVLFLSSFFWISEPHLIKKFFSWLLLMPALISYRLYDYLPLIITKPTGYLICFLVYFCLSLTWSVHNPEAKFFEYITFSIFTLYFVVIIIVSSQHHAKWLWTLEISLVILVTVNVIDVSFSWYSHHSLNERMEGWRTLHKPIALASTYAIVGAFCAVKFMLKNDKMSYLYLFPLLINSCGILLTNSRGPLLSFLVVIIVAGLLIGNRRALYLIMLISFTGLILLLIESNLIFSLTNRGYSFRHLIWKEALEKIAESWFIGQGITASPKVEVGNEVFNHFHNIFLSTWFYGGIMGLLLLIILIATIVANAIKLVQTWPWLAAFISGLLCLSVDGDKLIYYPRMEWLHFWLPLAMILAYLSQRSVTKVSLSSGSM